jgi:hypothetical protein
VAGCFEQGDEPSSYIKAGKFLDYLSDSLSRRTLLHVVNFRFCLSGVDLLWAQMYCFEANS